MYTKIYSILLKTGYIKFKMFINFNTSIITYKKINKPWQTYNKNPINFKKKRSSWHAFCLLELEVIHYDGKSAFTIH